MTKRALYTQCSLNGDGGIRTHDLCVANASLSQLSYAPVKRITGIEPATSAWEANILPLNYIRILETIILYNEVNYKSIPCKIF